MTFSRNTVRRSLLAWRAATNSTGEELARPKPSANAVVGVALSIAVLQTSCIPAAWAAADPSANKSKPSGTILLPLSPKLDVAPSLKSESKPALPAESNSSNSFHTPISPAIPGISASDSSRVNTSAASSAAGTAAGAGASAVPGLVNAQPGGGRKFQVLEIEEDEIVPDAPGGALAGEQGNQESTPATPMKPAPEKISAELGNYDEGATTISEDTTLKGTIQIVADDTEYDQNKNTFLGTGNAVAIIAGQNSKLEADMILYDQNNQTIDARGNVRIIRDGQLTTGSSFKFKVSSDEYLITNPDTEVQGTQVIARKGFGTNDGLAFKDGVVSLPKPVFFTKSQAGGPLGYGEEAGDKRMHPDAFLPEKPTFTFKARKMVYERYKERGNLTVFGGKLQFGKFAVPVGRLNATVGKESRVTFPVTPYIGNNMQTGGLNVGPMFHDPVGKDGVISWAPLLNLGGRRLDGTTSVTENKLRLGAQVSFVKGRFQTHFAYGANSNLVVGDIKYDIYKKLRFQAGVNRFLEDGMFGYRRARLIAEVVDNKFVTGVPFLSSLNFRQSVGWAQDNPQLIQLTPEYAKLFGKTTDTKQVAAFRLQEHINASTHPIFKLGNDKYGIASYITGGLALRGYSTGDAMVMGQVGPSVDVRLGRVRFQTGYVQSVVRGKSPFVFDQFIQGSRAVNAAGDIKVNRWLRVGGSIGVNLVEKLSYGKAITAAIGPDDFKVLLSRDMVRGINRFGFDVLYGAPIPFNRLVLKGSPDQGQLGGI